MTLRNGANLRLLVMALIVGLMTGVGVFVFRVAISMVQRLADGIFGAGGLGARLTALGLPERLHYVIVLALAGLLVGWLIETFTSEEKFGGVSSIMVAGWLAGGRLPYTSLPVKVLASALSLGAGASAGRVDPSVQIGANIGSFFGQWLHLSDENIRLLMAAGAASAIAAAFNAPIAGVFFAIEVILIGNLSLQSSGVVMLAAVASAALTQGVGGDTRVFSTLDYSLGGTFQLPLHVILGLLLAGVSWAVVKYLFWQKDWIRESFPLPAPILTALIGAVVGGMGMISPAVLGPGEVVMRDVINGRLDLGILALVGIGALKIIATGVTLSGRFVGGVFAPALFLGIFFGSAFGKALLSVPGLNAEIVGDPQSYAIAGMAGVLAGVVQAPITAILLVFELTNDYRLILPIMLTTVTASAGVSYLRGMGIYATTLLRHGISLEVERDIDVMQGVEVREAMAAPAHTINQGATLLELRDALRMHKVRALSVTDRRGRLVGVVTLGDLQRFFDQDRDHPAQIAVHPVSDIMTHELITAHPDDKLWQAIQRMGAVEVGQLPVVDRLSGDLVGVISRRAIISTYNNAIQRKIEEQHQAEQVRLSAVTGASVTEFHVLRGMPISGHYVRDLDLQDHFVIASIQRGSQLIVPRGHTEIRPGDIMTIVAEPHVMETLGKIFRHGPLPVHAPTPPEAEEA